MAKAVVAALVLLASLAGAANLYGQSAEDRTAARDVAARRGEAIVTVSGTLKARMTANGRDRPAPDQAVQSSGTVLDASGLTVVALSTIDPGNVVQRNAALSSAQVKLDTELVELKMRLPDGTEMPARTVLRDSDLDLLFVRPTTEPTKPLAAVESSSATFSAVDPVVLVRRLGELASWKAAVNLGTIEAVVERPRRFYLISTTSANDGLGSATFDLKGQFGGIVTLRQGSDPRHNALTGMQGGVLQTLGMVATIVPAADIREVAKQAPPR